MDKKSKIHRVVTVTFSNGDTLRVQEEDLKHVGLALGVFIKAYEERFDIQKNVQNAYATQFNQLKQLNYKLLFLTSKTEI